MPHLDSPTVFATLLDDDNGGCFKIQPQDKFEAKQDYVGETNILRSVFTTEKAQAELIDFMPITGQEMYEKEEHSIHRCVKAIKGTMEFTLECLARPIEKSKGNSLLQRLSLRLV